MLHARKHLQVLYSKVDAVEQRGMIDSGAWGTKDGRPQGRGELYSTCTCAAPNTVPVSVSNLQYSI